MTVTDPITGKAAAPVDLAGTALSALTTSSASAIAVPALTLPKGTAFGANAPTGDVTVDGVAWSYAGEQPKAGVSAHVYETTDESAAAASAGLPQTITVTALLDARGRLPLGLTSAGATTLPVSYHDQLTYRVFVEPSSGSIIDVETHLVRSSAVRQGSSAPVSLSTVIDLTTSAGADALTASGDYAEQAATSAGRATMFHNVLPILALVVAILAGIAAFGWGRWPRFGAPTADESLPSERPVERETAAGRTGTPGTASASGH